MEVNFTSQLSAFQLKLSAFMVNCAFPRNKSYFMSQYHYFFLSIKLIHPSEHIKKLHSKSLNENQKL